MTTNSVKEDFGYNDSLVNFWFKSNSHIPKGTFYLVDRKGKYYWYYQLPSGKNRMKYICSVYEGKNEDGLTSFEYCLGVLNKKYLDDFKRKTTTSIKISTLIDEFKGELLKEELDPSGRKIETTKSIRNGVNRFRDYSLLNDFRLKDFTDSKNIKSTVMEYLEYCKNRGLKRHTIRTYIKQVRYFLEWLSDEDMGKGVIQSNPITTDFIKKIFPTTRGEKSGISSKNIYYTPEWYDKMFHTCVYRVRELWNDFIKNGISRPSKNQPLGVGSDIVYFISLLQLDSGFRFGEVLTSYRSFEYWNNRKDKKNSSTFWKKVGDQWFLELVDYKGRDSNVPITTKIRSWVKPPGWEGEPTEYRKNGKPYYWDVNIIDVCMMMFRDSPFLFSSPNHRSHSDRHYGKTYYMNLFKMKMVSDGDGGEGWEKYGVLSSHDLRDYFITHKINSGISVEDLSQITRHSPMTMWKYYLRNSEDDQLKRQKRLDQTRKIKRKEEIF